MTYYTVGNPLVYDPHIADDPDLQKGVGGAVFRDIEDAKAAVRDGRLPEEWDLGHLPGAVYELGAQEEDIGSESYGFGAFGLLNRVPILRKVWDPKGKYEVRSRGEIW